MSIVQQAAMNLQTAHQIMEELNLLDLWRVVGEPILVGAVAYNLVISPDIDLEIYCDQPEVMAGFSVIEKCVRNPNVIGARYSNHLNREDKGIYFQIKYKNHDDTVWKVDMWLMAYDHPGPCARDLVEPLLQVLDDETREAILLIKEEVRRKLSVNVASIHIYEAVIDYNVRNYEEFIVWHEKLQPQGLTLWKPNNS